MVAGGGHWDPYSRRLTPTHDNAQFISLHPDTDPLPACLQGVKPFPGGARPHRPATFTNPGTLSLIFEIYYINYTETVLPLAEPEGQLAVLRGQDGGIQIPGKSSSKIKNNRVFPDFEFL